MSTIAFEVSIILLLIVANGVLSMSEMAIVSSRKARLLQLAEHGDKGAASALQLADSPNDFLSTVQIGITMVGILTGAFGGATLADEITLLLKPLVGGAQHYANAIAIGIVVSITTFLSLIVGELVPKRLALHSPEKVASMVARPMRKLSACVSPLVHLLGRSTNLILDLFGIKESTDPQVTEAEIHVLVEQAAEAGIVEESEQEMVAEVLRLGDRRVTSIMTPRTEIAWLDVNSTVEEIIEFIAENKHTRFPVADGSLDTVHGIVETKDLLPAIIKKQPINLAEFSHEPLVIPESLSALDVLERLRDERAKIALIMSEYGGLQGLITSEDIFHAIVGHLPEAGSTPRWEAVQREDGSWLLDGQMPIDEFQEMFDLSHIVTHDLDADGKSESEGDFHFETLAGFILAQLQRIPKTGEKFQWRDLHFEIVDLDRHRIDKVMVRRSVDPA
ncbi:MAG: hemolysin family protein [Candidatus Obscuribacterales bacterium]|nr:hemolysin family protein [Candidatus Obscuribacterales bacterium]